MLTLDSTVCCIDGILETEIEGEMALMSPEMGNYYSLNNTGSIIWKNIKSETKIESLISKVTSLYDVEEEQCKVQVINLLKEFSDLGLLIVK